MKDDTVTVTIEGETWRATLTRALRQGRCASDSWSIGDPGNPTAVYRSILAAGAIRLPAAVPAAVPENPNAGVDGSSWANRAELWERCAIKAGHEADEARSILAALLFRRVLGEEQKP